MLTATEIFCLNELGKRTNNEDYVSPEKGAATLNDKLFIVCDGVGGENKGEVASKIVGTSIQAYIKKETFVSGNEKEALQKAIEYANQKLVTYVSTDQGAKRMSTTLALILLGDQSVTAAWCGDTRIHHIRNGKVLWKSKDHSLVSELVSQGELTEEEARTHPKRNVITRSLNAFNANNNVDFHEISDFETNDYLLLCTDGFLEKINDQVIYKILNDEKGKDKAEGFLSYCNGITKDNYSMYLIKAASSQHKNQRSISRRALILSIILLLICIVVIVSILFLSS